MRNENLKQIQRRKMAVHLVLFCCKTCKTSLLYIIYSLFSKDQYRNNISGQLGILPISYELRPSMDYGNVIYQVAQVRQNVIKQGGL